MINFTRATHFTKRLKQRELTIRIREKCGRCILALHTTLVVIRIVHVCLFRDLLFVRVPRCMIGATSPRVSDEIYDGASRTIRALF